MCFSYIALYIVQHIYRAIAIKLRNARNYIQSISVRVATAISSRTVKARGVRSKKKELLFRE